MTMTNTNGSSKRSAAAAPPATPAPELPDDRQAAVEYGLVQYQTMAAERDRMAKDLQRLQSDLAANRVELEATKSRLADADSRVASAMAVRDQAVADRAKWETLFVSVQAQLRAFAIPTAPLVRSADDAETETTAGGV